MKDRLLWRLGLASNTLRYFSQSGIQQPSSWIYLPYSELSEDADGDTSPNGFTNLSMHWDAMPRSSLVVFIDFVNQARVNQTLYMTLNRAMAGGPDWIDVSGIPQYPQVRSENRGLTSSVDFKLNAITIINAPAVF